ESTIQRLIHERDGRPQPRVASTMLRQHLHTLVSSSGACRTSGVYDCGGGIQWKKSLRDDFHWETPRGHEQRKHSLECAVDEVASRGGGGFVSVVDTGNKGQRDVDDIL